MKLISFEKLAKKLRDFMTKSTLSPLSLRKPSHAIFLFFGYLCDLGPDICNLPYRLHNKAFFLSHLGSVNGFFLSLRNFHSGGNSLLHSEDMLR